MALVLLCAALWTGLLIESNIVRLLITGAMVIAGLVALVLFSDGVEQWWVSTRRKWPEWLGGCLHWLFGAVVMLAIVVLLGAFAPSIIGPSPSPGFLIVSDVALGALAGALMLLLTALTALLTGKLVKRVARLPEGQKVAGRLEAPLKKQVSWLSTLRAVAAGAAGMLATTWVADHVAAWPSRQPTAADVTVRPPDAWNAIWLPLLAWFVATGVVWLALSLVPPLSPERHETRRRATRASGLAVVMSILMAIVSASLLNGYVRARLSAGPHPRPTVTGPLSAARQNALATAFSPRLILASGERWDPTTVDWYVAHSHTTKDTTACRPHSGSEPDGCRTLNCPKGHKTACASCDESDPGSCAPRGVIGDRHFYYQYVDQATDTVDRPGRPGHNWAVIQYWFFYNYDALKAGLVTQWHQADWEQVSVLLEQRRDMVQPVEVAFSEHCYGADVPAAKVQWQGTHPVSYVGLGSHANYPSPNDLPIRFVCLEGKQSRYLGAAGLLGNPKLNGSAIELPIVNLLGLRDHTGTTSEVTDSAPVSMRDVGSVWRFHGYWGLDNNLHVLFGRGRSGQGPTSPQDQAPFKKPFDAMLCAPGWLRIRPVRASDTSWIC